MPLRSTAGGRLPDRVAGRGEAGTLVQASVAALVALASFAFGALWGSERSLRPFRVRIDEFVDSEVLGRIVGERRRGLALAYEDPARAREEMDGWTWAVPNQPTPFVGCAPLPGRHASATINEQQFRREGPLTVPKPEGTVRIFVVGGSTVFGVGAPSDEETIPALLEDLLEHQLAPRTGSRYEVVNAGNPGWASTHERVLIASRISEMEPDLVVSFSGNNDAHFGFLGLDVLWFRTYADMHFGRLVEMLYARILGRSFERTMEKHPPVPPPEVARILAKNVGLASAALEQAGATYVLCLQPSLAVTRKPLTERERYHLEAELLGDGATDYFRRCYAAYRRILPETASRGVVTRDLSTCLDDQPADAELFLDSYHFGDRGNGVVARCLYEALLPLLDPARTAAGMRHGIHEEGH